MRETKLFNDPELDRAVRSWLLNKKPSVRQTDIYPVRRWIEFLGARRLNIRDASEIDALEFKLSESSRRGVASRGRKDLCLSNATIYRIAATMSGFYGHLIRAGICDENPFEYVLERLDYPRACERREYRGLTDDEVRKLLKLRASTPIEKRNKAFIVLLISGALRLSEALSLHIGDIQVTKMGTLYLELRETKAGGPARQGLADWAKPAIAAMVKQRQLEGAGNADVLLTAYTWPHMQPLNHAPGTSNARKMFKRICAKQGITGVSPHCCRGTSITKLLEQGVDHRRVQDFSRHGSVEQVERYDKRRLGIDEAPGKLLDFG